MLYSHSSKSQRTSHLNIRTLPTPRRQFTASSLSKGFTTTTNFDKENKNIDVNISEFCSSKAVTAPQQYSYKTLMSQLDKERKKTKSVQKELETLQKSYNVCKINEQASQITLLEECVKNMQHQIYLYSSQHTYSDMLRDNIRLTQQIKEFSTQLHLMKSQKKEQKNYNLNLQALKTSQINQYQMFQDQIQQFKQQQQVQIEQIKLQQEDISILKEQLKEKDQKILFQDHDIFGLSRMNQKYIIQVDSLHNSLDSLKKEYFILKEDYKTYVRNNLSSGMNFLKHPKFDLDEQQKMPSATKMVSKQEIQPVITQLTFELLQRNVNLQNIWLRFFAKTDRITFNDMVNILQKEPIQLTKDKAVMMTRYIFETDSPISVQNVSTESTVVYSVLKTLIKIDFDLDQLNVIREDLINQLQPKLAYLEKSLFQKEMMKMIMQVGVTMGKEQAALFDYVWHKLDLKSVTGRALYDLLQNPLVIEVPQGFKAIVKNLRRMSEKKSLEV